MPDRLARYSFYITTNSNRSVLYCGVTNNLEQRLMEHFLGKGTPDTFTGKYYCYWLVYFEHFIYINDAIAREKESKNGEEKKKRHLLILLILKESS
ncbi:MAG: GIY-YIG nuclease family protein [Flavitalea sp.]